MVTAEQVKEKLQEAFQATDVASILEWPCMYCMHASWLHTG